MIIPLLLIFKLIEGTKSGDLGELVHVGNNFTWITSGISEDNPRETRKMWKGKTEWNLDHPNEENAKEILKNIKSTDFSELLFKALCQNTEPLCYKMVTKAYTLNALNELKKI